ncbi:hypothetical protein [Gordonia sp. NPDC003950]
MPLIEITRIGDGDPIPLSGGADQPFDGIRALGMGDVVASAGAGVARRRGHRGVGPPGRARRQLSGACVAGGGAHRYLDPEAFTADTALGAYQGVTHQVRMSGTPGANAPSWCRVVPAVRSGCR